jgi:gamma-glutamylaminecyclotransferase
LPYPAHEKMEAQPHLLLFVYGTLKHGCRNHDRLLGSEFVGVAWTKPIYRMYSCGSHPALVPAANGESVGGELYRVSSDVVTLLDDFEGAPYQRAPVELLGSGDSAWGYIYIEEVSSLSPCGPVWADK